MRFGNGVGRHYERNDVLAGLESRAILGREVLGRKGPNPHAKPGSTSGDVRLDDVGLVTSGAELVRKALSIRLSAKAAHLKLIPAIVTGRRCRFGGWSVNL